MIIELDGGQHPERQAADERRTDFPEQQGYWLMEFWNDDFYPLIPTRPPRCVLPHGDEEEVVHLELPLNPMRLSQFRSTE